MKNFNFYPKGKIIGSQIAMVSIVAVCCFAGFVSAEDSNLCAVDVDVALVLDVSGSMNDSTPSKCLWQDLEQVDSSMQCVNHNEDGLSEADCLAKPSPEQCSPPVYSTAIPVKIDSAKNAAKSFLDNLKTADQSALVTFSDTAQVAKSLSSDHVATKSAIDGVTVGGATNIGDAIGTAITELGSVNGNPQATKTIILLTDGRANKPNGSGSGEDPTDLAYAQQKATEAASAGYKIFTIGLGSGSEINEAMLQSIATTTGGQYHHAPDGSWLNEIYQTISSEICQYGSISGCKYSDLNNNGAIDPTDTFVSDWEVVLSGATSATQLTDQSGCYTFAGLLAGNYTISEGENAGKKPYTKTFPTADSYNITLSAAENVTGKDFANYFSSGNETCTPDTQRACTTGQLGVCSGGNQTCSAQGTWGECVGTTASSAEICTDGLDNDCDGQVDSSDSDCGPGILSGDIIITEIMQNPKAVSDTYGEWFELYNKTQSSINLFHCVIGDGGGDSHIILSSLIVPANGYVVLAKNGNPTQNGGVAANYVYSGFFMSNVSDKVILTCGGVEIDRVEYDGGPNFPNPNGASMILKDVTLDNNVGSNWCTSTSVFGMGDKGTPGTTNDACGTSTCTPDTQRACTTGQLGVCYGGNQTCSAQGTWGECVGTTASSAEICTDGLDNDCDGQVDSSDSDCGALQCGNGVVEGEEQCDNGSQNGQACSPSCDGSCSYCSQSCTLTTLQGSACSNGGGGGGGGGGASYYNLLVSKTGAGSGLIKSDTGGINCGSSCSNSYSPGTIVTLTVTPESGSTFEGWSGACSGTSNTCTLTMSGDKSVSAIISKGEVLGASTCSIYLLDYIKYGAQNNSEEVKKLQTFLNEYMGANLPITGHYGPLTMGWVNKFQVKYKNDVLKPWVNAGLYNDENIPTGYVYKTTKRWINMIKCPELNIPIPDFSDDRIRLLGR